jgi:hypothetical protein
MTDPIATDLDKIATDIKHDAESALKDAKDAVERAVKWAESASTAKDIGSIVNIVETLAGGITAVLGVTHFLVEAPDPS